MQSIVEILMERDGMTKESAEELLDDARADMNERLWCPEEFGDPEDVMKDWFSLENDYIEELL